MTRLRYFVDRPRGPRGGHNDAHYRHLGDAQRHAASTDVIGRPDWRVKGTILPVDLDQLLPIEPTAEDAFQFHERMALHHTSEMMRLRPNWSMPPADAPYLTTHDIATLKMHAESLGLHRSDNAAGFDITLERPEYEFMKYLLISGKLG